MIRVLCRYLPNTSLKHATFACRGFARSEVATQQWLEQIGRVFLQGYQASLRHDVTQLSNSLNRVDPAMRGFAYEGAAMGLALLDLLTFRPLNKGYWQTFISDAGAPHLYMSYVGLGWALASLQPVVRLTGRPIEDYLEGLHPVLRWLALDGYGFRAGYFQWQLFIGRRKSPNLGGYAGRAFDQGLGRSLWFVTGADPNAIGNAINTFPQKRRHDLWSGVGLACAYAGGVPEASIQELVARAGGYRPQLAQGAVFAAKARERANNLAVHTQLACKVLCGLGATEAASLADTTLENLSANGATPAFEVWRQRIQDHFWDARNLASVLAVDPLYEVETVVSNG